MSKSNSGARNKGANDDLRFLPLGGAGEIGMNLYLYGSGSRSKRQWLMVDCGVKFGDLRDPGIDIILPDIAFIAENRKRLAGIVLTHGHEDHLGALAWLWPQLRVPVYCTAFAAELLKNKFAEAGLFEELDMHIVAPAKPFDVGRFNIELVAVTHSIPESNAIILRTEEGTIVHSGDWKLDRTPAVPPNIDEKRLRQIGKDGVDVLVCDSTNVLREGFSPSERDVGDVLRDIIAGASDRVAVTTFASHVGRLLTVIRAAREAGREIVVAGRAMRTMIEAAREVGLMKGAGTFLEEEAYGYLPRAKVLLLCTGSQGESRAALARIAADSHPAITLDAGDLVIFSSKTIPGNEKAVIAVQNNLAASGIEIVTADDALVHTSGHPRQGELKTLYDWLKPKALVPMHGEMMHLMAHKRFAEQSGIADAMVAVNGDMLRLVPGPLKLIDQTPAGRVHVDGRLMVGSIDGPARFRRRLAFSGIVLVSILLDSKGSVVIDPQIVTDGLPGEDETGESLDDILIDVVDEALDTMSRARRRVDEPVVDTVRIAVRRKAQEVWGKKPVCHVIIHRI
jgi:ribonuclease J